MDQYLKLQRYSAKVLAESKVVVKPEERGKIAEQMAIYFDAVVFNIVSIMCLISILNNSSKIDKKTIEVSKEYIENKCKFNYAKMSGGRLGSATFLGKDEQMYSASHPTDDVMHVGFADGIARREMPMSGGAKVATTIPSCVTKILKYHGLTASKEIKNELCSMIMVHVDCFIEKISGTKGKLTLAKLNAIVKKSNVLHPLK